MKAIMYHYVRPHNPDLPFLRHLALDDFRQQLDYFEAHFTFVSQDAFAHALACGQPIKDGIVLTFDDGFKDHFRYVLPELKQRNIWGIFYIPTFPYRHDQLLDVHRIHMLLGKWGGKRIFAAIRECLAEHMLTDAHREEFHHLTYNTQHNDNDTNKVKRTLNYFIGYQYRRNVLDQLMSQFFPEEKTIVQDFYMTPNELRAMRAAGMTIGSHTVNHPVMSKLAIDDQEAEIVGSFRFLEAHQGRLEPKTFCYPYGGFHTFTAATEQLLEKHQCDFAFNVEAREIEANDLTHRKQALPRFDCNMFPHGACRIVDAARAASAPA